MIYLSTINEQGFIYYFETFYLKIGKFYTFFQLGKEPIMGPKISPGKSLYHTTLTKAEWSTPCSVQFSVQTAR